MMTGSLCYCYFFILHNSQWVSPHLSKHFNYLCALPPPPNLEEHGLGKFGFGAKISPTTCFINIVLLWYSEVYLLQYCLWLHLHYEGRCKYLWVMLCDLQKNFTAWPCIGYLRSGLNCHFLEQWPSYLIFIYFRIFICEVRSTLNW